MSILAVLDTPGREAAPPLRAFDNLLRYMSGCTNQLMEANCKGLSLLFLNKLADNSSYTVFPRKSLIQPSHTSRRWRATVS